MNTKKTLAGATTVLEIGFGRIGRVHGANVLKVEGAKLVITDPAFPNAESYFEGVQQEFSGDERVEVVKTKEEVKAMTHITKAVIATSTDLHAESALWVLNNMPSVKDIYLEKPASGNIAKLEEVAALAREKGVAITIGLQRGFDPLVQGMIDYLNLNRDAVKTIRMFSADDSAPPLKYLKSAGKQPADQGIHDIGETVGFGITKGDVVKVSMHQTATEDRVQEAQDHDYTKVTLETKAGQPNVEMEFYRANPNGAFNGHKIEFVSESGSVLRSCEVNANLGQNFIDQWDGSYEAIMKAFVEKQPGVTLAPTTDDMKTVLQLLELIQATTSDLDYQHELTATKEVAATLA